MNDAIIFFGFAMVFAFVLGWGLEYTKGLWSALKILVFFANVVALVGSFAWGAVELHG